MRKLGHIRLALDWANVRRLVEDDQPEVHGAIASAWGYDDKAFVIVNVSLRKTRNDRANRRTTNLRMDQEEE